jgi:hypothetical protein
VEVTGEATQDFKTPSQWAPERREKFKWEMAVKVLSKCPTNARAPLTKHYYPKAITGGSYRALTDEQGRRMSEAIRCAEQEH